MRVVQAPFRDLHRYGVDGEVPAGKVLVEIGGESDHWLARIAHVGLGTVGCDLHRQVTQPYTYGPEPFTLEPDRVSHPIYQLPDPLRGGIRGEVEIRSAIDTQETVPNDASHQVQPESVSQKPVSYRRHGGTQIVKDAGGDWAVQRAH